MKALVIVVALGSVAGFIRAEIVQQAHAVIFSRICNIEPGQGKAAMTLAKEMVELVNTRYPGARMSVSSGRWMTGFQDISRPVNQIRFSEEHPDRASRRDFTDILQADEDFSATQRKMLSVIDVSSCVETQVRAGP